MSRATMSIFIIAILLLIYGYLCRLLSIYFFWDSKHFGWLLVVTGIMSLLIDQRRARMARKQNIFFVRVGLAIIILAIAAVGSAIVSLKLSDTYKSAIENIKVNGQVKSEIGDIHGFGLFLSGPDILNTLYSNDDSSSFVVTVRGEEGYRDVEVNLERYGPMSWRVGFITIIHT